MDQSDKSFKIVTPGLGTLCIQPESATQPEIERTSLVIYPHKISEEQMPMAVEWAAASQCPIFCHSQDIQKLVKQGFGAYRFHGIMGYKEIAFEGGTIEMFPAKREKKSGIKGRFLEFSETFGFLKAPSFHVLVRPRGEEAILYLSSVNIDSLEWKVLTRRNPGKVIGTALISPESWKRFGDKVRCSIVSAREVGSVETALPAANVVNGSSKWAENRPSQS